MASNSDTIRPRKPLTKACDACRRKKTKCDTSAPPCSNCINSNTECVFSHVEKPRKTPVKSSKRVDELERRVIYMEALIKNAGLLEGASQSADGDSSVPNESGGDQVLRSPESHSSTSFSPAEEIEPGLAPPDPGFSITAPFNEATLDFTENEGDSLYQSTAALAISSSKHGDFPLPPKEEALPIIQNYFSNFNSVFPLFSEISFMQMVQDRYIQELEDDFGWWASLNVVLAISHRLLALTGRSNKEDDLQASRYMSNATKGVMKLIQRDSDLLGLQSLLGLAIIFQGTPNSRPANALVATSVRLAQRLGLHRQDHHQGLSNDQIQERDRVFWILYLLDKDFSLMLDLPPLQREDDHDIQLPDDFPADFAGRVYSNDMTASMNLFVLRLELSIVAGKIYDNLYSLRALKQDFPQRLRALQEMDGLLQAWKRKIPPAFQAENIPTSCPGGSALHLVILHLSYFNCLIMVHRISFQRKKCTRYPIINILDDQAGCPFRCFQLCLEAARSSMKLIKLLPQGNFACIWLIFYQYVSGLVILLANVIRRPESEAARDDLELVDSLLQLMAVLSSSPETEIGRIHAFCIELWRRATAAVNATATAKAPAINRAEKRKRVENTATDDQAASNDTWTQEPTACLAQIQNSPEVPESDESLPSKAPKLNNQNFQEVNGTQDWMERFLQDDASFDPLDYGSYDLGLLDGLVEGRNEDQRLRAEILEQNFSLLPSEMLGVSDAPPSTQVQFL